MLNEMQKKTVAKDARRTDALTQVERNKRWRARYTEKYREYQRQLMRKRRAEGLA